MPRGEQTGPDGASKLKEEFRRLDKNGDGTLDLDEIRNLLRRGMSTLGDDDIKALFDAVDTNRNGRIDFDEFVDYIHTTGGLDKKPAAPQKAAPAAEAPGPAAHGTDGKAEVSSCLLTEAPVSATTSLDEQPRIRQSRSSSGSLGRSVSQSLPGPADYSFNDKVQAQHPNQPSATIGNGPGHEAPGERAATSPGPAAYSADAAKSATCWKAARATIGHGPGHLPLLSRASSPGPGTYNPDDQPRLQHSRSSSGSIGRGAGHESLGAKHSSPGPADYSINDKAQAHHPNQPCATIGNGPGHRPPGERAQTSPGPGAYSADPSQSATCWRAARATIGSGPGHLPMLLRTAGPGPGAYFGDVSKKAGHPQAARATIGHGPGHRFLDRQDATPGPASYRSEDRARIRGGSIGRAPSPEVTSAMRQFKEFDSNHDGRLDFDEVRTLMRKGNPQIKDSDIRVIFDAVDRNGDARVDFNELVDFILPGGKPDTAQLRRRFKDAFAELRPGPGTYDTAVRRDKVPGGGFGKAARRL